MSSEPSGQSPLIVGIGGTTRPNSTTERTLVKALEAAERLGARTTIFNGAFLSKLPIYDPTNAEASPEVAELLAGVREADGVLVATPGYHGSVSGLVKNALDTLENLRDAPRPYFEGRAVGCIITADGWQACGTALSSLRTVIHALRGWPTPLGVTFNPSAGPLFDDAGDFREAARRRPDRDDGRPGVGVRQARLGQFGGGGSVPLALAPPSRRSASLRAAPPPRFAALAGQEKRSALQFLLPCKRSAAGEVARSDGGGRRKRIDCLQAQFELAPTV